jgi:hypothetical protein
MIMMVIPLFAVGLGMGPGEHIKSEVSSDALSALSSK